MESGLLLRVCRPPVLRTLGAQIRGEDTSLAQAGFINSRITARWVFVGIQQAVDSGRQPVFVYTNMALFIILENVNSDISA